MNKQTIPDGYVQDAHGRLVPESMVTPLDQLRDQTILAIVADAKVLNQRIQEFKARHLPTSRPSSKPATNSMRSRSAAPRETSR